jgi:hypothetical protein
VSILTVRLIAYQLLVTLLLIGIQVRFHRLHLHQQLRLLAC